MFNFGRIIPLFNQFTTNPAAFLASRGLNIPQEYMQSPETAAKYLMQNGNMSQQDINNIMQTASQFQGFMNQGGKTNR